MNPLHALAVSVTPVVLISACGLIALALYNRLGVILSRVRTLHKQKLDALTADRPTGGEDALLALIDSQAAAVVVKARLVRRGLFCLLAATAAFLICSLLGVAATLHPVFGVAALVVHVIGLVLFLAGIGWAARELALSLTPLEEEAAHLDVMAARDGNRSRESPPLRIAGNAGTSRVSPRAS